MLEQIEKTLLSIKTLLENNVTIRKLLCNNILLPLEGDDPGLEAIEGYITLCPMFEIKENYDKNSFINIMISTVESAVEDKTFAGDIRINVICNSDVYNIKKGIRPLCIANEVIKELHNNKLNVSNKISFERLIETMINNDVFGYSLIFSFYTGTEEINNY